LSNVVKLYRCTSDLDHWFAHIPGKGWWRFPARVGGWVEQRLITTPSLEHLNRVPLWIAFNTGLLETVATRNLERAA
jgi:hypothetical protein